MPEYRQHLFGQYSVFQSIFVSSIGITNACKDTLRTHNLTTSSRKMRDNTELLRAKVRVFADRHRKTVALQREIAERERLERAALRAQHFALLGRLAAGVSHEIR